MSLPSADASRPDVDSRLHPGTPAVASPESVILDGFARYRSTFDGITLRAKVRFDRSEWREAQADSLERLDLYSSVVTAVTEQLRDPSVGDAQPWPAVKRRYQELINGRPDVELAETFFNSVSRRLLDSVGVNAEYEFLRSGPASSEFGPAGEGRVDQGPAPSLVRRFGPDASIVDLVETILKAHQSRVPYRDLRGAATSVSSMIEQRHGPITGSTSAEILRSVFFRGKGAYLIGRLSNPDVPFVLALARTDSTVDVDAVLTDEDDVSILFSFTRSYFHVQAPDPPALVSYLAAILPRKPIAELYNSIGYDKHGKTERFRELRRFDSSDSGERFEIAEGQRGMVMVVFTVPGRDLVVKVIKDSFPPVKKVTRSGVRAKYRLVFRHDRAGRLIDAQEFEGLEFRRSRFSEELLELLAAEASRSVQISAESVVLEHAYVERRVTPLDLYVRSAETSASILAIEDYGQAIRDLAHSDIFPGDMLLKNFGVTRHGRVVFYDYDELTEVSACRFRKIPAAVNDEDEMSADPWFSVSDHDIFPEEFRSFLGLPAPLAELFERSHADIFDAGWWSSIQERLEAGEILEIVPYRDELRLRS